MLRTHQRRRRSSFSSHSTCLDSLEARCLLSAVNPAAVDGAGNNLENEEWGSTDQELIRLTTAEYSDGIDAPAGESRPSARAVSNAIAAQTEPIENDRYLTDYVWVWGQFLDHDIDLSESADPPESFNYRSSGW